jgi:hypothetical protein
VSKARCCLCHVVWGGLAVSAFSVRWNRSNLPFCSGCPGSIRSGMIPSLTHHTARVDSPPKPTLAKGGPLSLRMDRGKPYSLKARSRTGRTCCPRGWRSPWHTKRYLEAASATVKGLTRTPFPVRNHPLKSMHHRSLGCSIGAKGWLQGAVRRRGLRRRTSPARSSKPPTVLGGGPSFPGRTRLPVSQPGYQLLGTPGRVVPPGQDQPLCHVAPRLVGMLMGRPAEIAQAFPTPGLEALNSFVARLPADAKGSAKIRESSSPSFPVLYEPELLRRGTHIFPRHYFPPHHRLDYVLGKCYQCTRFVPRAPLSLRERGSLAIVFLILQRLSRVW